MKPARNPRDYLDDIVDASLKALRFVAGLTLEQFLQDDKSAYAVVRALELIGEAGKRIPPELRDKFPDIPWRLMAGIATS